MSAPPDPNSAANKIRLDVHVTSSPQLDFQNSYAKLAGYGRSDDVVGPLAMPSVLGRIQITDGSATFAGHEVSVAARGDLLHQSRADRSDHRSGCDGAGGELRHYGRAAWDDDESEADVPVGASAERERMSSLCWRWGGRRKRLNSTRSGRFSREQIQRRVRYWAVR